jgi:hypothetical protein
LDRIRAVILYFQLMAMIRLPQGNFGRGSRTNPNGDANRRCRLKFTATSSV